MQAAVLFTSFFILLLLTVPIGYSIGIATVIALMFTGDGTVPLLMVSQKAVTGCDSFPLMAVPFFMLAGNLMSRGGIAKHILDFFDTPDPGAYPVAEKLKTEDLLTAARAATALDRFIVRMPFFTIIINEDVVHTQDVILFFLFLRILFPIIIQPDLTDCYDFLIRRMLRDPCHPLFIQSIKIARMHTDRSKNEGVVCGQ